MSAVSSIGKFKSTPETYGLLDLVLDGLKFLVNRVREAWANRSCSIAQHAEYSKAAKVSRPIIVTTTTAFPAGDVSSDRPSKGLNKTVGDLLERFKVYSNE